MIETTKTYDFLVIGAGIAGASAAYELARGGASVLIAEMESHPGYHTTGRSAAIFTENYGNDVIRALTSASRAFFENPPDGFCEHPLLSPRGMLMVADKARLDQLELGELVTRVDADEITHRSPAVSPAFTAGGTWEEGASDIDVHALLQGFLKGFKKAGGLIATNAEIQSFSREDGCWQVATRAGNFSARTIVNAAGAWADQIAGLAGTKKVGLQPKRRTALTIDPGTSPASWPLTNCVDESWYFKPEAGDLMISPADETPSPPCDAQPDELDIGICIERIEAATTLKINRLVSKRAGLRSFVADKSMVCGYADDIDGFFWLAGQGGYGIQTSPAMARIAAALVRGHPIPAEISAFGVTAGQLAPGRSTL